MTPLSTHSVALVIVSGPDTNALFAPLVISLTTPQRPSASRSRAVSRLVSSGSQFVSVVCCCAARMQVASAGSAGSDGSGGRMASMSEQSSGAPATAWAGSAALPQVYSIGVGSPVVWQPQASSAPSAIAEKA